MRTFFKTFPIFSFKRNLILYYYPSFLLIFAMPTPFFFANMFLPNQHTHTSLEVSVGQKKRTFDTTYLGLLWTYWRFDFYPWAKKPSSLFRGPVVYRQNGPPKKAEWAVCLSSYLWKGWMVFLPRGKNWTSSRSTTTPDRWYWKFFFSGQLVLPMMCGTVT